MNNQDFNREILPLKINSFQRLTVCKNCFQPLKEELEEFLDETPYLNTKDFLTSVLFRLELKANNAVEGITDDIRIIEQVIENAQSITDVNRRNQIKNLYNGYRYILRENQINKTNLKHLYSLLSKDILEPSDKIRMGEYYREAPVYILRGGRLDDSYDMGIDEKEIEEHMNMYFEYVNSNDNCHTATDHYIKSQIMHYYFVFVHPYFDINGRTSRTVAMWYLLNNQSYPYIIFNRAISLDSKYDKMIQAVKELGNINRFINYMLLNVKKELEKECIMKNISESTIGLTALDFQTLEYLLSMNGNITVLDFCSIYDRFNDKQKVKDIFETMLDPLIQKGILTVDRETNKEMFSNQPNLFLKLNKTMLDNPDKIKRLVI